MEVRKGGMEIRGEIEARGRMEAGERWNPGECLLYPVRETVGLGCSLAAAP